MVPMSNKLETLRAIFQNCLKLDCVAAPCYLECVLGLDVFIQRATTELMTITKIYSSGFSVKKSPITFLVM